MTIDISKEMAEKEFERFCDSMDIDISTDDSWDGDDKKDFLAQKNKILKAIISGRVVIDDSGQAVLHPKNGEIKNPIVFKMLTGSSLQAMDDVQKEGAFITKIHRSIANLTGETPNRIKQLQGQDIKIAQIIATFFIAA